MRPVNRQLPHPSIPPERAGDGRALGKPRLPGRPDQILSRSSEACAGMAKNIVHGVDVRRLPSGLLLPKMISVSERQFRPQSSSSLS